jgi:hypothetical protein
MIKLFQRKRDDTPESRIHEATKVFFKYTKKSNEITTQILNHTQTLIDEIKEEEVSSEAIDKANQKIKIQTAVDNTQTAIDQHKPAIQASQDAIKKIDEMRKSMFPKEDNNKKPKKK